MLMAAQARNSLAQPQLRVVYPSLTLQSRVLRSQDSGVSILVYIATEEQLADGLTKALQPELYKQWRGKLGMQGERELAGSGRVNLLPPPARLYLTVVRIVIRRPFIRNKQKRSMTTSETLFMKDIN